MIEEIAETESQEPRRYPTLSAVGWVLLLTGSLYLLVSLLGYFSMENWALLIGELALLLPAYLYLRARKFDRRMVFRLNPVSWRVAGLSMVIGFAMTLLAIELDKLTSVLLPFPEQMEELMRQALQAQSAKDWIIIILATVVFAGIFEEMLFRGFVQNAFEQRHQPLYAIFITAVLFGAVHLAPWWFIQLIFIAMFLGIMAWKSDSIIPSAIVHAQNNLIAVLLANLGEDLHGTLLLWNGHLHPVLIIAAALILYFGLRLFSRFCEEDVQIPTLLNTPIY